MPDTLFYYKNNLSFQEDYLLREGKEIEIGEVYTTGSEPGDRSGNVLLSFPKLNGSTEEH